MPRGEVSLLSNLGLQQYIAKSEEQYVENVMSLANDEEELKYLHQNSKIKMSKTDLANSEQFT